jgi:hypothetical protein
MSIDNENEEDLMVTNLHGKSYWHKKDIDITSICTHFPTIEGRIDFRISIFDHFLFYHDTDVVLHSTQQYIKDLYNKKYIRPKDNKKIEFLVTSKRSQNDKLRIKFNMLGDINYFPFENETESKSSKEPDEQIANISINDLSSLKIDVNHALNVTNSNVKSPPGVKKWALNGWIEGSSKEKKSDNNLFPHRPFLDPKGKDNIRNILISSIKPSQSLNPIAKFESNTSKIENIECDEKTKKTPNVNKPEIVCSTLSSSSSLKSTSKLYSSSNSSSNSNLKSHQASTERDKREVLVTKCARTNSNENKSKMNHDNEYKNNVTKKPELVVREEKSKKNISQQVTNKVTKDDLGSRNGCNSTESSNERLESSTKLPISNQCQSKPQPTFAEKLKMSLVDNKVTDTKDSNSSLRKNVHALTKTLVFSKTENNSEKSLQLKTNYEMNPVIN